MAHGGSAGQAAVDIDASVRRWSFGCLCGCLLVVNATFTLLSPIFPQEADRRHVNPSMVGLVFSIYSFASVAASPLFGRLVQLGYFKRRTLLLSGLLVVCISTALFGFIARVEHPQTFLAACLILRAIMGVGCAAVDTASMALSAALYGGTAFLGTAMGIEESVLSIGWVIGPVMGGYGAQVGGFGLPFFITAALAFACYPALFCLMPRDKGGGSTQHAPEEVDVRRLVGAPSVFLILISAVLGAAIITFLDPTLGPHLLETLGYGPGEIGVAFAVIAAVYAAFTPVAGLLGDRIGRLTVMALGLFLSAAAYLLIGPIPLLRPLLGAHMWWLVWVAMSLVGMGAGMTFVPSLPALLHAARTLGFRQEGVDDLLSGALMGAYHTGGGSGPLIGGAAKHAVGFPWSGAVFAAILVAHGVAILILRGVMPPEPAFADLDTDKLAAISEEETASAPLLVPELAPPPAPPGPALATPGRAMPAAGQRSLRRNSSFGFRPGSGAGSFTAANALARSMGDFPHADTGAQGGMGQAQWGSRESLHQPEQ